jgi:hypothetical protein
VSVRAALSNDDAASSPDLTDDPVCSRRVPWPEHVAPLVSVPQLSRRDTADGNASEFVECSAVV